MKLSITQVFGAVSAINQLAGKTFVPATSFKIARLSARLAPEAELAEKQRQKLIEDFGAKLSKDGTVWEFPTPEAGKAFQTAWQEILDSQVDIHLDLLPLQALGSTELTPATMHGLMPILFIEEGAGAKSELIDQNKKDG